MFIATTVVSLVLAAVLVFSAVGKLTRNPKVMPIMDTVKVPADKVPWLAYVEIIGAIGLVVGLVVAPLGVVAAVGVVAYFGGAVIAHLRVNDRGGVAPAAGLAVLAVIALALRVFSA